MLVKRSQLEEGQTYYVREDIVGVFVGKDEDTIYFDCGGHKAFFPMTKGPFKGKIPFSLCDEYGDFKKTMFPNLRNMISK
jgi:hypothetical protein